jgi:RimJ/RimL family protein N-acetyltransferase
MLRLETERLILYPIGAEERDGPDLSQVILASYDEIKPFAPWVKQREEHTPDKESLKVSELLKKYLSRTDYFMVARLKDKNGLASEWVTVVELYKIAEGICSTGYWTSTKYVGNGYTTEALEKLIAYGIQNRGLTDIFATSQKINIASQRILEKLGFRIISALDAPEAHRTTDPNKEFQYHIRSTDFSLS